MNLRDSTRPLWTLSVALGGTMAALACDPNDAKDASDSPIAAETRDLKEATQKDSQQELQELEKSYTDTKDRLQKLRERMGRLSDGVTEEVMKERRDLMAAMRQQMADVKKQIARAEQAARRYNRLNDEATDILEKTAPPDVKAKVDVQLEKMPSKIQFGTDENQKTIRYETNQLPDEASDGSKSKEEKEKRSSR